MEDDYPIVVIKLVVKEPSEKRKRRQLLPTPENSKEFIMSSFRRTKLLIGKFNTLAPKN